MLQRSFTKVTSFLCEGNSDFPCENQPCYCTHEFRISLFGIATAGSFIVQLRPFYGGGVYNSDPIQFNATPAEIQAAFDPIVLGPGPIIRIIASGPIDNFIVAISMPDDEVVLITYLDSLIGASVEEAEEIIVICCDALPDLQPIEGSLLVIPDHVYPGETIQVTYTVHNFGQGTTGDRTWNDAIILTPVCSGDPEELPRPLIVRRSGPLASGSEYTVTLSVTIPINAVPTENFAEVLLGIGHPASYTLTIKVWSTGLSYTTGTILDTSTESEIQAAIDDTGIVGVVVEGGVELYSIEYTEPILVTIDPNVGLSIDGGWLIEIFTDVGQQPFPEAPELWLVGPPREIIESNEFNNWTCTPFGVLETPPSPDLTPIELVQLVNEVHLYTVVPPPFGTTTGGSYTLADVGEIQWDDSQETIQALYDAFYGAGEVVIGGDASQFAATYSGPSVYGAQADLLTVVANDLTGSTGVPTIVSEEAVIGGPVAAVSSYPGEIIRIRWTVINQGEVDVTNDWMDRLKISVDEFYNLSSPELANEPKIAPLAPAEEYSVEKFVTIPTNTVAGNYWLVMKTDADLEVQESNEENNVIAIPIAIGESPIIEDTPMVMMVSGF